MIGGIVIALLVFGFPVAVVIYGFNYAYQHRNDPLTWDEAYRILKANDCCTCEMCVGAHMRWGKRKP